ncbi:MAG: polysaccharide deacetylase family protein [Prevotellaceae bacterium]|jgi:peptidoglycan/xylan/chitin deacetylase (PgdA/CDA1 family)|nr:polysaccharide deacetylase family protein [Prevotellaceae bacterium]
MLFTSCKPDQSVKIELADELLYVAGGIVRASTQKKQLSLVFTAHEYAEGYEVLKQTLKKHNIHGALFFTGDFYRNPSFTHIVEGLKNDGHYMGAHSDGHLLYCAWENRDSLLITKAELVKDVEDNYKEMNRFGINKTDAPFYLPPYEWYNDSIAAWINEIDLHLINFTGGTLSNADYTTPNMPRYYPSDTIFNRILKYEEYEPQGLNGFILLTHLGTGPERSDKFFNRMDALIDSLIARGYSIVPLRELLEKQ